MMEIISTSTFLKCISKLQVTADELRAFEAEIIANPQAGDVIKGLKGMRKIRFSYGGRGKRGGGRCIYLVLTVADQIYLLLAYGKSQQTDLSAKQRKDLLAFIEELQ
jgi:mRNA-degrading endonuclease RelE of RelBE toxin-antitoxin system